jgi:hypothetical protein
LEKVEEALVKQSLKIASGNQTKAAKLLDISRDALRYRMQKLDSYHSPTFSEERDFFVGLRSEDRVSKISHRCVKSLNSTPTNFPSKNLKVSGNYPQF